MLTQIRASARPRATSARLVQSARRDMDEHGEPKRSTVDALGIRPPTRVRDRGARAARRRRGARVRRASSTSPRRRRVREQLDGGRGRRRARRRARHGRRSRSWTRPPCASCCAPTPRCARPAAALILAAVPPAGGAAARADAHRRRARVGADGRGTRSGGLAGRRPVALRAASSRALVRGVRPRAQQRERRSAARRCRPTPRAPSSPSGPPRGSACAARRARARSTRPCSACSRAARRRRSAGAGRAGACPRARSSTNGWRSHVSTFSWTTSFESANVAAESGTSSARGIGSRPRAECARPASSAP